MVDEYMIDREVLDVRVLSIKETHRSNEYIYVLIDDTKGIQYVTTIIGANTPFLNALKGEIINISGVLLKKSI